MKEHGLSESTTKRLLALVIVLGLASISMSAYTLTHPPAKEVTVLNNTTTAQAVSNVHAYNITGSLLEPPTNLASAPVITQNQSFGNRLTNINAPLNASELGVFNNAPNSYFETAAEMLLNGTLNNTVGTGTKKLPLFTVNGKPTVIYLGSSTCIFCGENRWAMALALSRFGSFSNLFKGYSSVRDGDVPTLYWRPVPYTQATTASGDFYNSNYINFIAVEDSSPITGGFVLNPLPTIQKTVNSTGNTAYADAFAYILSTKDFSGTPFTIWGAYEVGGADAVIFANNTNKEGIAPLQHMTHEQVLGQLSSFNDQFSWSEYAAADLYVAMVCKTLNNTASACTSIPSIPAIESRLGL